MRLEVHSTRLFPKYRGADQYRCTGIAARCDWVLLSDEAPPHLHLVQRTAHPRHIFLSLRSPFAALAYFVHELLPKLETPFVLVSGSEDVTVPRQTDRRWRVFTSEERTAIEALLRHPMLLHWFAENLDEAGHPRLSPLPVGLVFAREQEPTIAVPAPPPLHARPPRLLCAHRVREGPQWDARRRVSELCRSGAWKPWSTVVEAEVPETRFVELVEEHAFVLCVDGGGLDPSPKAWQAILHGAIPIMRASPLQAAYARLPVAFVPAWEPEAITAQTLAEWRRQLATQQDRPATRTEVVRRLGISYWWDEICAKLAD